LHDGRALSVRAEGDRVRSREARRRFREVPVIAERLHDTVAIVDHLQAINRTVPTPEADGARSRAAKDVLDELVRAGRRHGHISFLRRGYRAQLRRDSIVSLFALQESLTNAVRHAQAQHITIDFASKRAAACADRARRRVWIHRQDAGFGMRGMQEARRRAAACDRKRSGRQHVRSRDASARRGRNLALIRLQGGAFVMTSVLVSTTTP
jgi:glucose-6-phosphate-specific signal transduction histidine kinase